MWIHVVFVNIFERHFKREIVWGRPWYQGTNNKNDFRLNNYLLFKYSLFVFLILFCQSPKSCIFINLLSGKTSRSSTKHDENVLTEKMYTSLNKILLGIFFKCTLDFFFKLPWIIEEEKYNLHNLGNFVYLHN